MLRVVEREFHPNPRILRFALNMLSLAALYPFATISGYGEPE